MNRIFSSMLCAALLVSAPAWSQEEESDLPQVQQSGDITYVTGGIGDEERAALEANQSNYNLRIISAMTNGNFAGDTDLVITDASGNEVLATVIGPLFYANLPAGNYVVVGTNEGQQKKQNIRVGKGKNARIHFSWKEL